MPYGLQSPKYLLGILPFLTPYSLSRCGDFQICPQIFQQNSLQKVEPSLHPLECGVDLVTCLLQIGSGGMSEWLPRKSQKTLGLPPCSLDDQLEEVNSHIRKTFTQPKGNPRWRTGLLPIATTQRDALQVDPSGSVNPSDDLVDGSPVTSSLQIPQASEPDFLAKPLQNT